jgi:hypothetical protein
MKYIYLYIIFLFISTIFFSCFVKKKRSPDPIKQAIITLKAKSCYGKCKTYNFTAYEDLSLSYEGLKHVHKIGNFASNALENDFQILQESIDSLDFSNLDSEYLTGARDLQVFEMTFKGKMIKFQKRKAPNNLLQALELTEIFIENSSWINE